MPRYPYRDLGTKLNRDFRNNLNANFDDIEADIRELYDGVADLDTRIDNIVADLDTRIDNIVADVGNSNTEIVDARYDSVNNVTYPTLKDRLDDTSNKIGILNNELSKQNQQSTTIGHGINVINASQNSPLDIRIEGRTLVNLLGIQGRTATSATVTLDSAKYYVLVNEDGTNVTVDGVSQTVPYKFTGKSSVSLSWTSGKVALYEVDATEYSNILTTWAASEVNRRYPYVDSVQHVQNPYVIAEGENLLPPFTEWKPMPDTIIGTHLFIRAPYEAEIVHTTANTRGMDYTLKVIPGATYTLSATQTGGNSVLGVVVRSSDGAITILSAVNLSVPRTFTIPPNVTEIYVRLHNMTAVAGTNVVFTNPMLTIGSQAKPFVPRNPSYLFAEVKLGALADKKDILWKDGQDWKVTKWVEKDIDLNPTTFGFEVGYYQDYTGYKRVGFNPKHVIPSDYDRIGDDRYVVVKYDGKILKNVTTDFSNIGIDECTLQLSTGGGLKVTVADTDSGWGETYTPTLAEVEAYFLGWRMCNGTYGQPYDGTGTKTWYPIGDTDLSRAVTTLPTSAAPTIAEGKIGYYKLSYVRSTPVTEVVTDKVEGDLVVNGATQVEVGSGIVVREKAVIAQSGGFYRINDTSVNSQLKYKVSTFLALYKNGVRESVGSSSTYPGWYRDTVNNPYGKEKLVAKSDYYDPTAEYTVTYLLLDRHLFTTNILAVTATYDSSLKSVVDSVVAKQSDLASNQQALIRSVAELYKRVKALGG